MKCRCAGEISQKPVTPVIIIIILFPRCFFGGTPGDMTSKIIQGPVDICIGTALGLVWGFLLIFVPPPPWAKVYRGMQGNENQNDGKQVITYNLRNTLNDISHDFTRVA